MTPQWATPAVVHLIAAALADRDAGRLPVLADALEDAGYAAGDENDYDPDRTLRLLRRGSLFGMATLFTALSNVCYFEQRARDDGKEVPLLATGHFWAAAPKRCTHILAGDATHFLCGRLPTRACGGPEIMAGRDISRAESAGACRQCLDAFNDRWRRRLAELI